MSISGMTSPNDLRLLRLALSERLSVLTAMKLRVWAFSRGPMRASPSLLLAAILSPVGAQFTFEVSSADLGIVRAGGSLGDISSPERLSTYS